MPQRKNNDLELYLELSVPNPQKREEFKREFYQWLKEIGELSLESRQAMEEIFDFLKQKQLQYNAHSFTAKDVLYNKEANCLGLTVILGLILQEKGFNPNYEILLTPHDSVYRMEQMLFRELYQGEYFQYDNPILQTEHIADEKHLRFAPLEHPIIVLSGNKFDLTDMEKEYLETFNNIDSERQVKLNFPELISGVLVDQVRQRMNSASLLDYKELKNQLQDAIKMWPENREAYSTLYQLAFIFFDDKTAKKAKDQYQNFKGEDSRYFYYLYEMTREQKYLDKSLELYPSNMLAFVDKNVLLSQQDPRESKFNLAVASRCISVSCLFRLKDFYLNYASVLGNLFGQEKIKRILDSFNIGGEKEYIAYYLALYQLTKNKKYLRHLQSKDLTKSTPLEQLKLSQFIPELANKFHLQEQYGSSRIFQSLISHDHQQIRRRDYGKF